MEMLRCLFVQWWKKVPNCQSEDSLIENDSSKSHPIKYYLSKSLKVFGFKYTKVKV